MADEKVYTLGEWCGYTQYRCRFCPFDVLDDGSQDCEAVIYEHYLNRHYVPPVDDGLPAQPSGSVLIANKSGREVAPPEPAPASAPAEPSKRNKKRVGKETEELDYGYSGPDAADRDREEPGDAAGGGLGGPEIGRAHV